MFITPVGDEEAGSYRGTKWLKDAGILDPDILVVGEQTNNQVAIAERAVIWIEVKFKGKASHGAMPWNGDNPIIKAAQFMTNGRE